MLSPISVYFGEKACPWETFESRYVREAVSPPTPTFVCLSQDSHNEIYNICDKYMHLQPPYQKFCKQEA